MSDDPAPAAPATPGAAAAGPRPIRLVVLFGGRSAEHDVSRVTARHVLAAADPDRYRIAPIGITRDGRWVVAEEAARALAAGVDHLPDALAAAGPETEPLPAVAPTGPDEQVVVLPLLHGPNGEDGTVQGLLELADVPYVGCGVLASAMAMDKGAAKELFAANGIPQARWRTLHADEADAAALAALVDDLGLPLFVKPANMGSSIGVSKAHDAAELAAAVDLAATYDEWLVVEEAVVGREVECAVLGRATRARASLPGEVEPGAEFYDYADKYHDGAARIRIPADLPDDVVAQVQALSLRAFRALRGDGMARVDFFYEEGGRGLLLNEVNTIPGFTPISMYPRMWEASGLAYGQLIDELVRLALERHSRKRRRTDVAPAE
jgi:D-alanine-D-alanine ligase